MLPSAQLSTLGRIYVGVVIALGFCIVSASVYGLSVQPIGYQWYLLVALTLVSGSATVKLPSVPASISISETFVFTAVLLYGPAAGTLIVALDGLVISFWIAKRRRESYRAWFNMSAPAVSLWSSAHLFFFLVGIEPLAAAPRALEATPNSLFPSLFLFALTYFGLNSWLIAFAIAVETRSSPLRVWWNNFVWLSLNYFCGASVAALLVFSTQDVDVRFLGLIVPLLLVLYFTFKNSMDRVEDANKHVDQISRLYLSTIETLAMAIDAKDQITHGHIRRVQTYAVGLARGLGVTDDKLIKAIEAAALLHDMGKLAVPEHILNKPGKLTASEFDKMKLHATVGADILSAIEFPYPVVPIVRHHHEQWDGGGYPAGLAGTDIPIGARILAVADCFDALTSDRPYRPRLSDEQALAILVERRGTLYDPLVVDTFVQRRSEITSQVSPLLVTPRAIEEITDAAHTATTHSTTASLEGLAASAHEMLALAQLSQALAGHSGVSDTADVVMAHVKRLVPFDQSVLFLYNRDTDELEVKHSFGPLGATLAGIRFPLGHRISGWVAVNRQTARNSDPALDLVDFARSVTPRLRSCLATPLVQGNELVGVLSLYSTVNDAYNQDDACVVEAIAQTLAYTFRCAVEFENTSQRDPLTGLPNLVQLERLIDSTAMHGLAVERDTALLLVRVIGFSDFVLAHGRTSADDLLRHVVKYVKASLRISDILFRHDDNEFVGLLHRIDSSTAALIGAAIRRNVSDHKLLLRAGDLVTVQVAVACVSASPEGSSIRELLHSAGLRLGGYRTDSDARVH
jgi:diguanylate cyclase (GGDEF)-like protein/putative nucleotidyltransferase with HDIG domain